MAGYITLSRDIEKHWIWNNTRHFQWWVQLIFMASYEDRRVSFGNATVELKRGQLATTTRLLMKAFCASNHSVYSFLRLLEKHDMIQRKATRKMTLISIVNYNKYQQNTQPNFVQKPLSFASGLITEINQKPKCKAHGEMQQTKEINKEEKIIKSNITQRENELNFFEQIRKDEDFWNQATASLNCDLSQMKKVAEAFFSEMLAKEKYHSTVAELKNHLINWARKAFQNEAAPKNYLNNGKRKENAEDKYAARRGSGVNAKSADDYNDAF